MSEQNTAEGHLPTEPATPGTELPPDSATPNTELPSRPKKPTAPPHYFDSETATKGYILWYSLLYFSMFFCIANAFLSLNLVAREEYVLNYPTEKLDEFTFNCLYLQFDETKVTSVSIEYQSSTSPKELVIQRDLKSKKISLSSIPAMQFLCHKKTGYRPLEFTDKNNSSLEITGYFPILETSHTLQLPPVELKDFDSTHPMEEAHFFLMELYESIYTESSTLFAWPLLADPGTPMPKLFFLDPSRLDLMVNYNPYVRLNPDSQVQELAAIKTLLEMQYMMAQTRSILAWSPDSLHVLTKNNSEFSIRMSINQMIKFAESFDAALRRSSLAVRKYLFQIASLEIIPFSLETMKLSDEKNIFEGLMKLLPQSNGTSEFTPVFPTLFEKPFFLDEKSGKTSRDKNADFKLVQDFQKLINDHKTNDNPFKAAFDSSMNQARDGAGSLDPSNFQSQLKGLVAILSKFKTFFTIFERIPIYFANAICGNFVLQDLEISEDGLHIVIPPKIISSLQQQMGDSFFSLNLGIKIFTELFGKQLSGDFNSFFEEKLSEILPQLTQNARFKLTVCATLKELGVESYYNHAKHVLGIYENFFENVQAELIRAAKAHQFQTKARTLLALLALSMEEFYPANDRVNAMIASLKEEKL